MGWFQKQKGGGQVANAGPATVPLDAELVAFQTAVNGQPVRLPWTLRHACEDDGIWSKAMRQPRRGDFLGTGRSSTHARK